MLLIHWIWTLLSISTTLAFPFTGCLKSKDECVLAAQDIRSTNATTFERAVACLDSFPHQPSQAHSILDSLRKTIQFYVFKDIATGYKDTYHPSSPIALEWDIYKELDRLDKRVFTRDREFHDAVFDTFSQLYDPHTRYISSCYHRWSFIQPWILTSFTTDKQRIFIKHAVFTQQEEAMNSFWSDRYTIHVTDYIGWEVTHIHNKPAVQAIQEYAQDSIFMARDPNALGRVAYQQGSFKPIFGYFTVRSRPPKKDHVTYTLRHPQTQQTIKLKVPFMAKSPKNLVFTDKQDYYEQQCLKQSDPKQGLLGDKSHNNYLYQFEPGVDISTRTWNTWSRVPGARQAGIELLDDPVSHSTVDAFYKLDDSIGVFKLASFHDDQKNEYLILRHWIQQLEQFKADNVTHLIIDVTDNAGGYICLGNALLSYFFPQTRPPLSDFIAGGMFEELAYRVEGEDDSVFHYNCDTIDPSTMKAPRNSSWMHSGPMYQRGKGISKYTHKIMFNCNSFYKELPQHTHPLWPSTRMTVVSNGFCGSTCAVFVRGLHEVYNVTVYGVGGIKDTFMGYSEFAGGQVYSLNALQLDFLRAGLYTHPELPRPLEIASVFSFTIRQVYSTNYPDTPMEFGKSLL